MLPSRTSAVFCERGQPCRPLSHLSRISTVSPPPSTSVGPLLSRGQPDAHLQLPAFFHDHLSSLVNYRCEAVPSCTLQGKLIGLYFSASWCHPCRIFSPRLDTFTKRHPEDFVPIFISLDLNETAMRRYLEQHPAWLALPFKHQATCLDLADKLEIQTLPTLIVCEADTGRPVSAWGVEAIQKNPCRCLKEWRRRRSGISWWHWLKCW
ncbi:hypothetical protein IWQ60_001759 [Tieghemiomyces parasiticus]|uniref:protein-disulfide reductase n=1 Tax=Tieghemiomyces parasiticus TaxID=78921 RepID=A0A9W8AGE5_9FUNG|nr:hypothetical protein IWQ60_001759 [Tieghemiomyces parasiticus]